MPETEGVVPELLYLGGTAALRLDPCADDLIGNPHPRELYPADEITAIHEGTRGNQPPIKGAPRRGQSPVVTLLHMPSRCPVDNELPMNR